MRKLRLLMLSGFLLAAQFLMAQTREVAGKVTDGSGAPLAGVSIRVKGTNTGTSSGNDGAYSINMPKGLNSLIFSYIGYEDQEVDVKGNSMNISLSQFTRSLNEVVVTGYGSQVKRDVTGSIARVKGSDVQNMPVPNLSQALQGRAAGVFVEAQNGKVGEGIKVRVRGSTSINGSNEPLYVVDGVPLVGGIFGSASADINFNDVESFDILKDASATAIYGSRAANGVILITTKRGKNGKTKFTLNTQYGTQDPTGKREFLNAAEFIELFSEAAVNTAKYHYNRAGNWRGFASEAAAITNMTTWMEGRFNRYSGYSDWRTLQTNTDWQELAFDQDAKTSQIELNAQGGNDKTKFFISGSVNNQDGILIGNKFQRMGLRFNLDNQVNNWLKIGVNINLTKTERNRVPDDNAFTTPMQLVALAPITPVRNNLTGALYDRPTTTYYNGLIDFEDAIFKITGYRNQGNIYTESRIAKGLTLRNELGLDMVSQNEDRFWTSRTLAGAGVGGAGRAQWLRNTRWITNNYLNYITTIKDAHKIDATVGMAFENRYDEYAFVTGQNYADESIKTLAGAGTINGGSNTINENNLVSYFGRVNYSFKRKYLASISARSDGDSRFGNNYKYGFFPAASLGWIASDESFLKNIKWLSFLKIRGSYGILGNNSGLGFYQALSQYGPVTYGATSGLRINTFGNENLRWEKTATVDIGFEFGIFNNRVTGEFNWYNKQTSDMLLAVPTPSPSGTTSVFGNIGEMENKGIEFVLNTVNVAGKNLRWTTTLNVARNRNKLTKLDGQQQQILPSDARFANALIIGQPIGIFYGVKFAGADPANGDPLFYKQDDKTTTNIFSQAGNFIIGDPNPDWIGGITNTVTWKGVELNFLFQGVFGNQVQDGGGGFMSASADWFDNQTRDQLKRWKNVGDITNVPQARINRFGDFDSPSMSTRYVYDASYLRLKNLTLAFNVPQKWAAKAKLSNARLYLSGVNLLTFTDYPGWDPEVNTDYRAGNVNQGSDFYAAPQIKSFVFGLTIGL